ncbi:MAG: hypothetical protein A2312_03220 [Candidatus Staskawiczbacteria bacterium RIFOXYB2_FULL_32_9]|uniref:Uncharacterized protein n=1 Tax=Candidatus Staskawiczbacteria bacterium RIFOXYD1_FULL_32_13 TaxID=1802234 RepID=A0A1G2JMM8_9BACT|nr:MAG: hypothetical protein A2360_02905 [Candidatus Staskawiczbacteria bacterium RIFOXYB1_FULL_32_11]OGZ81106.1 MAG: hypothetical protein A2312_03220 [Candidatus Staskawiczbacteria bacterium RIFOXYB2_FULL_32_9]OGZ87560.1 MAG: hypothetical protein A2561_00920 [Candidatus Staskawiczbacteria bacterium RIFOXYD1_FULL_32_13]OGZ87951.1 MAG: hypothetical protein A2463_00210 [Candidatus Staskawiczbacteria bacterium RIFOXYC2_FULL_32_10]
MINICEQMFCLHPFVSNKWEKEFFLRRKAMSNGDAVLARLFKLWAMVCKLVMDGKRSADQVCDALQAIVDEQQFEAKVKEWVVFYERFFGLELDVSRLKIPEQQQGFDRLIIVAQGMTPQRLFEKCKKLFPTWKWTEKNLDEIITSVRTAQNGAYAVWVRDRVEADEENKNCSANDFSGKGGTETLEERMLHELKYFRETGKHLDVQNWTLCASSRYSDGGVPCADWFSDEFRVYWDRPDRHFSRLRARSAVSQ